MGFYGNITNTSNTTFQFDRIYPNRLAMDANANNDGIFIGRYVLVEYEQSAAYPNIYINNGKYYSSPNFEEVTRIKYKSGGRPASDTSNDVFYLGEFGQKQESEKIYFYMCDGYETVEENLYATFKQVTAVNKDDATPYLINHNIDYEEYKNAKGYDSSVWTKVNEEKDGELVTRYRNIADLNSVVPTFDIAADAPTMTPITPHFDADSTNVYYKLHMQSPYGFRVKQGIEGQSDDDTVWYRTTYNKEKDETKTEIVYDGPADIYYNQAGFNPEMPSKVSNKAEDNYIKLEPTGESGAVYAHGGRAKDIQEFSLHLPAIGNMMSDAWDIIHGPNRDDYKGQWKGENDSTDYSSLQGRLNALSDLQVDEIPVKRLRDGQIIGSKINGGKSEQEIYGSLDDAWIQTLVDGNTNTISIHHTFNSNKNGNSYSDIRNKQMPDNDTNNNINLNDGTNTLDINTPIIDATGHVVGKNIETVTLPYGYKTIKVNNTLDTVVSNAAQVVKSQGQIADNTQDTLILSASNRWIKLDNNTEDTIKIGHQVNPIEEKDKDLTDLNDGTDTITIQDTVYDNAGHVTANQKHTYTLPYGYKTIEVVNNTTESDAPVQTGSAEETADNTQDTLKFSATNKWIKMKATGDNNIEFGHEHSILGDGLHNLNAQTPKFGKTFNIQTFTTDKAGHLVAKGTETVTIPHSTILDESNKNMMIDLTLDETEGKFTIHRENLGSLVLNDYTTISGTRPNQISAGDTLQAALGKIETTIENLDYADSTSNITQFISKVTQSNGKIEVSRSNAGTLLLTGYNQGTNKDDISSADTINSAFAKLQNQITYEENRINTILTGENDLTGTLDTFIELQSYINEHGQEAADMAKAIENEIARAKEAEEANQQAISDEAIRADLAEKALGTRIDNLDYEKTRVNNYYISSIKQTDGLIEVGTTLLPIRTVTSGTTNGTILVNGSAINVGGLKSAAYTESSAYAKSDVLDTKFKYGTEQKTIQNLMDIVKAQEETINNLTTRIENLENPPQDPDNSGDEA